MQGSFFFFLSDDVTEEVVEKVDSLLLGFEGRDNVRSDDVIPDGIPGKSLLVRAEGRCKEEHLLLLRQEAEEESLLFFKPSFTSRNTMPCFPWSGETEGGSEATAEKPRRKASTSRGSNTLSIT
jgi:hypothetical protein